MAKKNTKVSTKTKKSKAELVIVVLAGSCLLLALGVGLLYQQKEMVSQENYSLQQQFVDQNSQIQTLQQKVKTMEATTTPGLGM